MKLQRALKVRQGLLRLIQLGVEDADDVRGFGDALVIARGLEQRQLQLDVLQSLPVVAPVGRRSGERVERAQLFGPIP